MDGYCNSIKDTICQKKMLKGLDSQSTTRKSNGHFHPQVRFAHRSDMGVHVQLFLLFCCTKSQQGIQNMCTCSSKSDGLREMTFLFLFSAQEVLGSTR